MSKVWAITSGNYSDYGVKCICKTKEDAERLLGKIASTEVTYKMNDARIESFEIYDATVEPVEALFMSVDIWDDGRVEEYSARSALEWPFDSLYKHVEVSWTWVRAPIHKGQGGRLDVMGVDLERVRKVYSDVKAQLCADPAMAAKARIGRRQ